MKPGGIEEIASFVASPVWRRQIYAFSIVGIYGVHERFVRELADDIASLLSRIYETYDALPERIRQHHERLSLERAREFLDGKTNSSRENLRQHLSNLHACLAGGMTLNQDIFSDTTSNFRTAIVKTVIARLAIDLPEPSEDQTLKKIIDAELSGIYSSIGAVIDDLADRRNEIAHGSDFEIVDTGQIFSILSAVYAYDCWVYREVSSCLLQMTIAHKGRQLAKIEKTYTDKITDIRSIASVNDIEKEIKKGDVLYVMGKEAARATVRSIEKGRAEIDKAIPGSGPYGLNLGLPVKAGSRLMWLPTQCASIETTLAASIKELPQSLPSL